MTWRLIDEAQGQLSLFIPNDSSVLDLYKDATAFVECEVSSHLLFKTV
jgi:hypothetical protein